MKKLSLFVLLFGLLLTACSDDDKGNGSGGDKGKIVGLNIKDAKLIYGVGQASGTRSSLKSGNFKDVYLRQVTTKNQNIKVNWLTESGDTTSVVNVSNLADINDDFMLVSTGVAIDDPDGPSPPVSHGFAYLVDKKTGNCTFLNSMSIDFDDFASYYDGQRYCYVKALYPFGVLKIDMQTYTSEKLLVDMNDIKILPNGLFFAHMMNGKHKLGNFKTNEIKDFAEAYPAFQGYDVYIPFYGPNESSIMILCGKYSYSGADKITDFELLKFSIGSSGNDYKLVNLAETNSKYKLTVNSHYIYDDSNSHRRALAYSVDASDTRQIFYIYDRYSKGIFDEIKPLLINCVYESGNTNEGLSELPTVLSKGFSSNGYYDNYISVLPNAAINSDAFFNASAEGGFTITKFTDMSQKTIETINGYSIDAIVGNHKDNTSMTFMGSKWIGESQKQCVGKIDVNGNAEILQEFAAGENESMTGFLMELK